MSEKLDKDDFCLTANEIKTAQDIINQSSRGRYTLKKLYGKAWQDIVSPTSFGERFAQSVTRNMLQSIALHNEKTPANALQYDVKGGRLMID